MTNATHDYGDLRVTMTSTLDWIWSDLDSGATTDFEGYHPRAQGNLRPLGSIGFSSYGDRSGKFAAILVGNNPNSTDKPAVASPLRYEQIWRDEESGGEYDGSFWRPVAPSWYVALGDICQRVWSTPSTDRIWCVRSDLVQDSNYFSSKIWDDHMSGATRDCSVWEIGLPDLGINGSENIPISSNTFRANNSWSEPNNSLAQVLVLPNPKKFKDFTTPPPSFTKNNLPKGGDIFNSTDQCQATLPFTVYFPPTDAASLRAIRYPFCTLSRRIAWYIHTVHTNNGGGSISDSTTVKKGVS
ncbi:hypothetical protein sscle_02g012150 [Sclerotinia sclerotiorum 1980 UF-70]|uniref:Insecticidal crystal toxin domain-containing protein n=1 Tax=Sclerotinia sclerotiorum (strain ATCC 18683 / 1980 / Ss-1) TaxID=665079 RepID=A0A1D9PUN8_SCLS1|nr:hypothetical protein sscle_02g012150 [Sclerotinia sclerotiorum 1980 UF-70]